jgi:hypothetical protein
VPEVTVTKRPRLLFPLLAHGMWIEGDQELGNLRIHSQKITFAEGQPLYLQKAISCAN